jgi:hypothetical protein
MSAVNISVEANALHGASSKEVNAALQEFLK